VTVDKKKDLRLRLWYWIIMGLMLLNIAVYIVLPSYQRALAEKAV
jgi:hypothetical protein